MGVSIYFILVMILSLSTSTTTNGIILSSLKNRLINHSMIPLQLRLSSMVIFSSTDNHNDKVLYPVEKDPKVSPETSNFAPNKSIIILYMIPLLWGTYGIAIKSLFKLNPAPPELLFNFFSAVISSLSLNFATAMRSRRSSTSRLSVTADTKLAGIELGAYLFVASTLQIFAMQYNTIVRVAFITQLTTVFAPLLSAAISRQFLSIRSIISCAMAFTGVLLLSSSEAVELGGFALSNLRIQVGDLLSLGAALIYACHVVRLGVLAPRCESLSLATAKENSRLVFSVLTVAAAVTFPRWLVGGSSGLSLMEATSSFFKTASFQVYGMVALIALWQGSVVTALPTYLQSVGQRNVSSSTAAVIYASQPLWSSIFAVFLFGEHIGRNGIIGGVIILVGVFLSSTSKENT